MFGARAVLFFTLAVFALSGPCTIRKSYNVSVEGISTNRGIGGLFRVTKDGACLLITLRGSVNMVMLGIDLADGKVTWKWPLPSSLNEPDDIHLTDEEDSFVTYYTTEDIDNFNACSVMVKVSFNATHAWTAWQNTICSPIYGQLETGAIVKLLRTQPNGEQVAIQLDKTFSSELDPAHVAAVVALNGTRLWRGNLTVAHYNQYQDLLTVSDGNLVIINQYVAWNPSDNGSFLFSFANDGVPTMIRSVNGTDHWLFQGRFSDFLVATGTLNGVQAFDIASGSQRWSVSNANLLLQNVTWPNGLGGPLSSQQWSRVGLGDTIFLVDFVADYTGSAAYVCFSYDLASGRLVWENTVQFTSTSCYTSFNVLPADSFTPVVLLGQTWNAFNPKTGAVLASGKVPFDGCVHPGGWTILDLDGSSVYFADNPDSSIFGNPGKK